MERKACTLNGLNRPTEAIAVCDQLVSRFADDMSDPVQLRILVVLRWKARWQELLGDQPRAASSFREIVDRFPGHRPRERDPSGTWAKRRLAIST